MEELPVSVIKKHFSLLLKMIMTLDSWRNLTDEERKYIQFVNSLVLKDNRVTTNEADDKESWMDDIHIYCENMFKSREEALALTKNDRLFGG